MAIFKRHRKSHQAGVTARHHLLQCRAALFHGIERGALAVDRQAHGKFYMGHLAGDGCAMAQFGFGRFDRSQEVEFTGVITGIDFVNPHSYLHLDTVTADGEIIDRYDGVIAGDDPFSAAVLEIVHPGGCVVRVSPGFDRDSLRRVLDTLGAPPSAEA